MKIDGRTLSHDASETLRRLAVRRVKEGERPSDVVKSFGLCRTSIYRWLRAVKRGGEKMLAARKASGRPSALDPKQKLKVRRWINGKDPRQWGFDFGLWTRKIVAELIASMLGVSLGLTAVGRLLHELDITPQKPLRRAYERDPKAIARWTKDVFPMLRKRAKRLGATIFFLDEAGVRSDQVLGRAFGLRGKTPEVRTSGQRQSVNAISAIIAQGGFWYELYTERLNVAKFLELLRHFMRAQKGRVFLVLDGHPVHTARIIADYVQSLKGRLELHFLPGYAPELNPDEFVWNHLKNERVAKKPLRQGESLRERVRADLDRLKSRPAMVRSFFGAPSVAYVRD